MNKCRLTDCSFHHSQLKAHKLIFFSDRDSSQSTRIESEVKESVWCVNDLTVRNANITFEFDKPFFVRSITVENGSSGFITIFGIDPLSGHRVVILPREMMMLPQEIVEKKNGNRMRHFQNKLNAIAIARPWKTFTIEISSGVGWSEPYGLNSVTFHGEIATDEKLLNQFSEESLHKVQKEREEKKEKEKKEQIQKQIQIKLLEIELDFEKEKPQINVKRKSRTFVEPQTHKRVKAESTNTEEKKKLDHKRESFHSIPKEHSTFYLSPEDDFDETIAKKAKTIPESIDSSLSSILNGVVFVISGLVNPERSTIRNMALTLGAEYRQDWCAEATHLISSCEHTPKMKQALKESKGKAFLVNPEWIRKCRKKWKRVDEKPFLWQSSYESVPHSKTEINAMEKTKPNAILLDDIEDEYYSFATQHNTKLKKGNDTILREDTIPCTDTELEEFFKRVKK